MASRRGRARGQTGPYTNITRQFGAWSVHIARQRRVYSGWFADAVWGGRQKALLRAQHYRDQLLMRVDADTRVRRRPPRGTGGRKKTVGLRVEPHRVDGKTYSRAVGYWADEDGIYRRRRYLVERYGLEEACRLAAKARKAGVDQARRIRLERQRQDAAQRLSDASPPPTQVRDPLSRKGIRMPARRARSRGGKA